MTSLLIFKRRNLFQHSYKQRIPYIISILYRSLHIRIRRALAANYRVDADRINEVGPDRACAEWLMRNGAYVKWTGDNDYLKDYNLLPTDGIIRNIKEIDATDASIMHYGFGYFRGCKYIARIKFDHCLYLENKALSELHYLKESLRHLQINSCWNITDDGVKMLRVLSKLQSLYIRDLPYLKNKEDCLSVLKPNLPECDIQILNTRPE